DAPIIADAARQSEVRDALRLIAEDERITEEEARRRWQELQEADLLLESGGDPEDVSVAHAVGVAQWIYETGSHAGLRINLPESNGLTTQIDPLKNHITWLEYLAAQRSGPQQPGA